MILIVLLTVIGILFGYLLAVIAPEELTPGKKYFSFLRKVLLGGIFAVIVYLLLPLNSIFSWLFPLMMLLVILAGEFRIRRCPFNFAYYPFFIFPLFLSLGQNLKLVLAVLIFLYGFPLGTFLYMNKQK